jgi:serine/threonine protein kinase
VVSSSLATRSSQHLLTLVALVHFQGIIHRDIKPANLMWTSDRRTVKITDFGVAHISAAQRLAGSGSSKQGPEAATTDSDANLHLLFDDSELCKTAGTPSFLAPEVVFDFGTEIPPLSSSDALAAAAADSRSTTTLQAPAPHRPPITKAIDVWALGVTLYCLLFGKTPFRVESNHEFALYGVICTQDWDVGPFMGLDHIPTEGRHHNCPNDKPCSEGAEIIKLLERLLEKDMSKRITLDEVKASKPLIYDSCAYREAPQTHPLFLAPPMVPPRHSRSRTLGQGDPSRQQGRRRHHRGRNF